MEGGILISQRQGGKTEDWVGLRMKINVVELKSV